jgi:hypothetical protein
MPEFLEGFFSATWLLSVRFLRRRLFFYDAFFFWCLGSRDVLAGQLSSN